MMTDKESDIVLFSSKLKTLINHFLTLKSIQQYNCFILNLIFEY